MRKIASKRNGFHLSDKAKKEIEKSAMLKAEKLARETKGKLRGYYVSLIATYYTDSFTPSNYKRTYNLYKSAREYYKHDKKNKIIYGGVNISDDFMNNYRTRKGGVFRAEHLLKKFVFNKEGTWHGGNWHGGYGVPADVNIYDRVYAKQKQLIRLYSR